MSAVVVVSSAVVVVAECETKQFVYLSHIVCQWKVCVFSYLTSIAFNTVFEMFDVESSDLD